MEITRLSARSAGERPGLGYARYRYDSLKLRRWLSRDPIGEEGGENLYAFTFNKRINDFDDLGHRPQQQRTPPTSECGPDITGALTATLSDVESKFTSWKFSEKCKQCAWLSDGFLYGDSFNWDINILRDVGFAATTGSEFAVTAAWEGTTSWVGTGAGLGTVQISGKCYRASAANYALWGKANKLCNDWFEKTIKIPLPNHPWTEFSAVTKVRIYRWIKGSSESEDVALTRYGYKGGAVPSVNNGLTTLRVDPNKKVSVGSFS